jgi:hypothetical protein
MFDNLPGPARERQILEAVKACGHEHSWSPVTHAARGHHATLYVSTDALKIEGVRVATTADTAQRVADLLGASLQTTLVSDLSWEQAAVRVPPQLQNPDVHMSDWSRVVQHSQAIDKLVAVRAGLTRNVGKSWVLSDRLKTASAAANYGWYAAAAPYTSWSGRRMWQTLGTRHNTQHVDYSQTLVFLRNTLEVDGVERSLFEVMRDSELSWLVNDTGVMTVTRMPGIPSPYAAAPGPPRDFGLPPIAFKQAAHYTKGRPGAVDLVVIHDAECAETAKAAENVMAWMAGPQAPQASTHYTVDSDSITQSVRDEDTAWHAPGVNPRAIGVEHAGLARQTAEEWLDSYSDAMLRLSARLVASLCSRHHIPPRFVDAAGLRAGWRGITTHAEVTKAYSTKGGHWDPGPTFPLSWYLNLVTCFQA